MRETVRREIVAAGGVVTRRDLGAGRFDSLRRTGQLTGLLPGVAALPEVAPCLETRALAARAYDPDAVIGGATAAALTWWPELAADTVPVQVSTRNSRAAAPGYRWTREAIPAELTTDLHGLRLAVPALTVLQLIPSHGGRAVDEALRRRAASLAQMHDALRLTPDRPGNPIRRALLKDSRDEPWSEAERFAHRALRRARIRGWAANLRVTLDRPDVFPGSWVYLDIGFRDIRLGLEIDGTAFHTSPAAMTRDRSRDLALTLAGWQIVRFPAAAVETPAWVDVVTELVRRRSRETVR